MAMLEDFLNTPTPFNVSRLISIPILHRVLHTEYANAGTYRKPVLELVQWIYNRFQEVLNNLLVNGESLRSDYKVAVARDNWQQVSADPISLHTVTEIKETGTCYSQPQIHLRPVYPNLKYEQQKRDSGAHGGKCSKYYNEYGKRTLTGGIMGAWCTHVICYGFHCIPRSEGRDDVFSAMVTRWPKAPKHVIYDFACALGPYCMLREPEFFADTKFLIDNFHTANHTKCDRAWFLSSYSALDPHLAKVNSSAAECGNSGLDWIRKSISYMSQNRAILYMKIFISVWNRRKLRKQLSLTNSKGTSLMFASHMNCSSSIRCSGGVLPGG